MKKALIFYLWGRRNAGDMAICLGATSLLVENGYKVTFVSRFSENQLDYIDSKKYIEGYFENAIVKPGIFLLDRDKSFLSKGLSYVKGAKKLLSPFDDKRLKELITDADIVFLNGGNLLRGKNIDDYARIFALFYPFRIAAKHNKKIVSLPQSTARSSKFGMKLIRKKLLDFNQVFIRESNSYELLNKEITDVEFIKTTDIAFYITDNMVASEKYKIKYHNKIMDKKRNIAIVLRVTTIGDLGEFNLTKKEKIAQDIVNFINKLDKKFNVFFVIQTLKDKQFTEYVASKIDKSIKPAIVEEYDTFILREIYKNMDFVVAMRLHAAILSMTACTPVIGYFDEEWGLKNPGIMDDVGLPWTSDGSELIKLSNLVITKKEKYQKLIREFIIKEKIKISKYI